jgi:phosphate transport system permease protein
MTLEADALLVTQVDDVPRPIASHRTRPDAIYRLVARSAGATTLAIMAFIGVFLALQARPALGAAGSRFLTAFEWAPGAEVPSFGVAALLYGTIVIACIAMLVAIPLSIATALFISEYAPRRLRRPLTSAIDLFAAVPSVIYGMWGLIYLTPRLYGTTNFLTENLAFIPIFEARERALGGSMFVAGLVVSLMVMPITTSIMREVFAQAPRAEIEGALALGATRWGVVRTVILPFGRGGIIGGSMLGLGRAMGETIAVLLVISFRLDITARIFETGASSIASQIASAFAEADSFEISALMAIGLVLFAITLIINLIASSIVARSRSGRGVEI